MSRRARPAALWCDAARLAQVPRMARLGGREIVRNGLIRHDAWTAIVPKRARERPLRHRKVSEVRRPSPLEAEVPWWALLLP